MKVIRYIFLAVAVAISVQSHACKIVLQDRIQVPFGSADIGNSDRLALTRHYLTAREWSTEGARAQIEAAAFATERNPKDLAAQRGENVRAFLMQLGLSKQRIDVQERIIDLTNGEVDPDDKWQIGVEFVPNCPSSGCESLCNTPKLRGVASYAITAATPGPAPGSDRFSCADAREPTKARILEADVWSARTEDKSLTLIANDGAGSRKALANICYRVTTSAREYVGITDDRGRTQRMQLLGPELTRIEMKVDADQYPASE